MSDEKLTPTLTLNPNDEANKAENTATKMNDIPMPEFKDAETQKAAQDFVADANLSDEEKAEVTAFSKQIDVTNSTQVLQYGAGAQKKVADFSDTVLKNVKSRDLGEIGQMLSNMVIELKEADADAPKKRFSLFKKPINKIEVIKARYAKAETNLNAITDALEKHQVTLLKDVAMLDKLYDTNLVYFKELTMYILAGDEKLADLRQNDLPAAVNAAKLSGRPEDTQKANDLANMIDRFDKKLYDLKLTRNVAMQMAPQIRLVQNNDVLMAEKIQSSLVNTIPLWKSQMVLALGVEHASQAAKAQREVTDLTNEMLKKNAATLKQNTIDTAKESERGIVDIETLKQTNQTLISTFDDVLTIQEEGRKKRADAEVELRQIENDLKEKLLEVSNHHVNS